MELLILLVVGVFAWAFLPKIFSTHVQAPGKLRGPELEDAIVELKAQIFQTSAYENEAKYCRLHDRLTSLIAEVLDRHWQYVRDAEARPDGISTGYLFVGQTTYGQHGLTHRSLAVNPNVGPPFIENDVLLYLCFLLYLGGRAPGGEVEQDPKLMLKILDDLIERDFPPAMFFKGLVLKYGQHIYSRPRVQDARVLLERARSLGVGAATVELESISKYVRLEHMDTCHDW